MEIVAVVFSITNVPGEIGFCTEEISVIARKSEVPGYIHVVILAVKLNDIPRVVIRIAGLIRNSCYISAINVKLQHQSVEQ